MEKVFKYSISGKRKFRITRFEDMWQIEVSYFRLVGWWLWQRYEWSEFESLQYFPNYTRAYTFLQKICA